MAEKPEIQDGGDSRRSIGRELRRGSLELIVLHLLKHGEAYGYEIVSKLTTETDGALGVTDGTLYPVLYRLERAGFVEVRWETQPRGVPRKYYRLTESGRTELAEQHRQWSTVVDTLKEIWQGPGDARPSVAIRLEGLA